MKYLSVLQAAADNIDALRHLWTGDMTAMRSHAKIPWTFYLEVRHCRPI